MSRRGAVGSFLGIVALLALCAAPAFASTVKTGGITYVKKTFSVRAKAGSAKLSAACPEKLHLIGGGEVARGGFRTIEVRQSAPHDLARDRDAKPDDDWRVVVRNLSSNQVDATATAVCAKGKFTYPHRTVHLAPHDPVLVRRGCPGSQFAYSGGGSGPSRSLELDSEYPSDATPQAHEWGVFLVSPHRKATAHVYAICGKELATVESDDVSGFPAMTRQGHKVPCPTGTRVYGGGVFVGESYKHAAINSIGPVIAPHASGVFSAFADFFHNSDPQLTAYATCGPTR